MTATQRHVRQLRLRAADETSIRRGAILVEDAMRTVSLPALNGGRVIVLRRLDLGRIDPTRSPAALAGRIERIIRDAAAFAVPASSAAAKSAEAVWFPDAFSPVVELAARVASNRTTAEWFWPRAVPRWRPGQPAEVVIRELFETSLMTAPVGIGAGLLLDELRQRDALTPLLRSWSSVDVERYLQCMGWSHPVTSLTQDSVSRLTAVDRIASHWRPIVETAVRDWGHEDQRSHFLTAMILTVLRPARLLDAAVITEAVQLLETLAGAQTVRRKRREGETPGERQSSARRDPAVRDLIIQPESTVEVDSPVEVSELDRVEVAPQVSPGAVLPETSLKTYADPSDDAEVVVDPLLPRGDGQRRVSDVVTKQRRTSGTVSADERALTVTAQSGGAAGNSRLSPEDRPVWIDRTDADEVSADQVFEDAGVPWPEWVDAPVSTEYAGFYFTIGVLSRLGIEEVLRAESRWVEWELPARILLRVAERLSVKRSDPMTATVSKLSDPVVPLPAFSAPVAWEWNSTNGTEQTPPAVVTGGDFTAVLDCWVDAIEQWLASFTELNLRDLVQRPGMVAWTRTHIDVMFDHGQTDLRVRIAGLDVDPGWVAWLGRVVSFHYTKLEQAAR